MPDSFKDAYVEMSKILDEQLARKDERIAMLEAQLEETNRRLDSFRLEQERRSLESRTIADKGSFVSGIGALVIGFLILAMVCGLAVGIGYSRGKLSNASIASEGQILPTHLSALPSVDPISVSTGQAHRPTRRQSVSNAGRSAKPSHTLESAAGKVSSLHRHTGTSMIAANTQGMENGSTLVAPSTTDTAPWHRSKWRRHRLHAHRSSRHPVTTDAAATPTDKTPRDPYDVEVHHSPADSEEKPDESEDNLPQ